ncbi:MAG TPA: DUF488 family protein [Dokdonella sp.]|uniref:DUF488 domain-containing protein n=1 Tax=Dokdonella sp. TaxID=2291710 RepID=UPI002D7E8CB8|nr:DUF488 family protein [Dokdonella sp.]HET9031449.1 DUF488 family protein [Dokdonella sp.]
MSSKTKPAPVEIRLQRAYEEPGADDGYRVLVDHFWPRGRSRESLKLDEWAKDLAPEAELIKWFGHKPERWLEFRQRFRAHLDEAQQVARLRELLDAATGTRMTLVYGAKSETENQAVVIREALLEMAMTR